MFHVLRFSGKSKFCAIFLTRLLNSAIFAANYPTIQGPGSDAC